MKSVLRMDRLRSLAPMQHSYSGAKVTYPGSNQAASDNVFPGLRGHYIDKQDEIGSAGLRTLH